MKTIARKVLAMVSALAVTGIMFVSMPMTAAAYPSATVYPSTNTGLWDEDDSSVTNIPFGFTFNYYGTDYTEAACVTSNGTLGFDIDDDDYEYVDLTTDAGLGDFLYPLWSDNETANGVVSYTTIGTAPNRMFVTQWAEGNFNDLDSYYMPTNSYQAILFETTNEIQFQYRYNFGGAWGTGAGSVIGIGSTGGPTGNVQFSYETASIYPGLAIRFTPDGGGGYTMNSGAAYLPIHLQATDEPGPATLIYPANDAYDVPVEPILEWSPIVGGGVNIYNLYVSTNPNFPFGDDDEPTAEIVVLEEGLTDPTYSLAGTPLQLNTRYYWFVESVIDTTAGTISEVGTFFTGPDPNAVPEMPYTGR